MIDVLIPIPLLYNILLIAVFVYLYRYRIYSEYWQTSAVCSILTGGKNVEIIFNPWHHGYRLLRG